MTVSDPDAPKAMVKEVTLLGEYIKNLSFESPRATKLMEFGENPEFEFDVDVDVAQQSADLYELTLNLQVHAKNEVDVIYHLELSYGGLFRLRNVAQELRQRVLLGDCPKLLFPSLRRVISDITYNGGFPPLMLDFGRLPGLALRQF